MKRVRKFTVILFVITMFASFGLRGQNEPTGMGMPAPAVVAKPTFESVEGGMQFKIWMMSVIDEAVRNDSNEVKNNAGDDIRNTHHIMVEVREAAGGKQLNNAALNLEILSPTGKTETVELETMSGQYGGNIPLPEKGEYKLNLNVSTEEGRKVKAPFSYKVR